MSNQNFVPISYRKGSKTSKISVQPAIFEAYLNKFDDDESAVKRHFSSLAIKLSSWPEEFNLSLGVQTVAFVELLPAELQAQLAVSVNDFKYSPIKYYNKNLQTKSKFNTFKILESTLNILHKGQSDAIHKRIAEQLLQSQRKNSNTESPNTPTKTPNTFSHLIRERVIDTILAYTI